MQRVEQCTPLWASLQQACRWAAAAPLNAWPHGLPPLLPLLPFSHTPDLTPRVPCRAAGVEVLYTVIQSLTADGRDRSLDYKLSGFHVPPGSWDAQVRATGRVH